MNVKARNDKLVMPPVQKIKKPRHNIFRQPGFNGIAMICIIFLYSPIVLLMLFSFNDNRSVILWTEFSFRWYAEAFNNKAVRDATLLSFQLAAVATFFATIVATMAALATTRTRPFKGQLLTYTVINQPLMVPEIVTAVSTLALFTMIKKATGVTGIGYLMLAHTAFCIPFAYMPIRARLEDMSLSLEQAAADLYATPWQTFRYVTLPMLTPGIISGAMLAFVVSFDDLIITLFVGGPGETTLPIYMLGKIRRGITPEINAVSTLLLALTLIMLAGFFLLARRRK